MGVSIVMGVAQNGWFLLGKIPLKLGWFGGTPISGNHHMFMSFPLFNQDFPIGAIPLAIPICWYPRKSPPSFRAPPRILQYFQDQKSPEFSRSNIITFQMFKIKSYKRTATYFTWFCLQNRVPLNPLVHHFLNIKVTVQTCLPLRNQPKK